MPGTAIIRSRLIFPLALALTLPFFGAAAWGQPVELEWDPNSESDLAGYNVYRSLSSSSGFSRLNGSLVGTAAFSDATAEPSTTYYYRVTAVNTSGMESDPSNTISVTTQDSNQPPLAADDFFELLEDNPSNLDVLANDSDPEGDPLSVEQAGPASMGSVTVNADGTVRYDPAPNFSGSDSFLYTVSDGQGNSAEALVEVNVQPVNDPPLARDDSASGPEDTALTISVLGNDSDPDPGDSLTLVEFTQPSNGGVERSGGSFLYTPEPDFNGVDSFTYTLQDSAGATDTATVSVEVTPVNDPPVAADDAVEAAGAGPVTVAVLTNDSDVDGDPLSVASATAGEHGSTSVNADGTITYTPGEEAAASDAFSYVVSDGNGEQASAMVEIRYENSPPVAVADAAALPEDESLLVEVLANDSDPDGDPLTVTWAGPASHGVVELRADGSVFYRPETDFHGEDAFSYTVADPDGASDSAQVAVTVEPVNDAPRVDAGEDLQAASKSTVVLSAAAEDPEGDPVSFQWAQLSGRKVKLFGDNSAEVSFRAPNLRSAETLVFEVTASDGSLQSSDTVSVSVTASFKSLVFPAQVKLGREAPGEPFVGIAVVNSKDVPDQVELSGLDERGREVAELPFSSLSPFAQAAISSLDLGEQLRESAALRMESRQGPIQGFFMIGDNSLSLLDGVGGRLDAGTRLYFPLARRGQGENTVLYLFNPGEEVAQALLCLHDATGRVVGQREVFMLPSGTMAAGLEELFGTRGAVKEGYITLNADRTLQGFQLFSRGAALATLPAKIPESAPRLIAPHFFVDEQGKGTEFRLLNPGRDDVQATVRAFDDDGIPLAEANITVPAAAAFVCDLGDLLGLSDTSGHFEADLTGNAGGQAEVLGSVTFESNKGRALASLPLTSRGLGEQVFLHVAQSEELDMFTGFALVNPSAEIAEVSIQAFDESGQVSAQAALRLAPGARLVELLDSELLFGPSFNQLRGHLRVSSSQPVVAFSLFGDFRGEVLAAIESQPLAGE